MAIDITHPPATVSEPPRPPLAALRWSAVVAWGMSMLSACIVTSLAGAAPSAPSLSATSDIGRSPML